MKGARPSLMGLAVLLGWRAAHVLAAPSVRIMRQDVA